MLHDHELANRFTYHPPHGDQAERYERIRAAGLEFARLLAATCPASPELIIAAERVDEAVMHANAAIARHS